MLGWGLRHSRHRIGLLLAAAATALVVDWLFGTVVFGEYLFVDSVATVVVVLGVLFGIHAAAGVGVGVVIADGVRLMVGLDTLFAGVTLFGFGTLSHALASASVGRLELDCVTFRSLLSLLAAVLLAALLAATFRAWNYELLGRFPFYTSFAFTAVSYLLGALLAVPPILIGLHSERVVRLRKAVSVTIPMSPPSRWVITVAVLWPALATIGSVGFRIRERIQTPFTFRELGIGFVYEFVSPALFGRGGRRAQVLLGAVVLVALGYAFTQSRRKRGDARE